MSVQLISSARSSPFDGLDGRQLAALSPEERPQIGSAEYVADLLQIEMAVLEQEQPRVVLLDTKHRVLGTRTVHPGSVNQALVPGAAR